MARGSKGIIQESDGLAAASTTNNRTIAAGMGRARRTSVALLAMTLPLQAIPTARVAIAAQVATAAWVAPGR
ncbi:MULTISPECIES: hypothetical protein [unclassified Synechococcus]|uniref:hypothetical protein n=1 Tax=unclassified Synechococcus TaxID=2626047 RepID=UPI000B981E42|nr:MULTISPECIES: hypothetical protein [unclassified Synechococcus]MCP9848152.1 hypothetical protein [Synechococcus sp. Lug-A]